LNLLRRLTAFQHKWSGFFVLLVRKNIDLKLRNKLDGPMHYKISVTCVYNGHTIYILCCNKTTV